MLRSKLRFVALALALTLPASAQKLGFLDELLDRFTGNWILSGDIAGDDVFHPVNAR